MPALASAAMGPVVRLRGQAAFPDALEIAWWLVQCETNGSLPLLQLSIDRFDPGKLLVTLAADNRPLGFLPGCLAQRIAEDESGDTLWGASDYGIRFRPRRRLPEIHCRLESVAWADDHVSPTPASSDSTRPRRQNPPADRRDYARRQLARALAEQRQIVTLADDRFAVRTSRGDAFHEVLVDSTDANAPLCCSCPAGRYSAAQIVPCLHAALAAIRIRLDLHLDGAAGRAWQGIPE